ncbi:MAG: RHS repeat protein, partial [bacterium]|nr:RHS repeat protein [bacterium]
LTLITRPDGKSVSFGYDGGGRLDKLTIPRGQITYTYDNVTGNISTIKAPDGGTLAISYDSFLPLESTWAGSVSGSVGRTYDNNFLVTSRSVNGAYTANFTYETDGLIAQAGSMSITRDALNGLITNTGIDNITETRGYNIFGEPSGYTAAFDGTDFYTATYTRDKLGRITQKVETVEGATHTFDYSYELTDRLKEVKKDGTVVSLYQYDDNGNRLSVTKSGTTITGTYDGQDRLESYGDYAYAYTDNGELTSKTYTSTGSTTSYQYDVLGNLMGV